VARKNPREIAIISPEDGSAHPPDQPQWLKGGAWDKEDGNLPGSALTWTDSISGTLGTGEELYILPLSPGWHTITLTATDSDGMTGSDSVRVCVGCTRIWLPLVLKGLQ
jgi:hypothetical protein